MRIGTVMFITGSSAGLESSGVISIFTAAGKSARSHTGSHFADGNASGRASLYEKVQLANRSATINDEGVILCSPAQTGAVLDGLVYRCSVTTSRTPSSPFTT